MKKLAVLSFLISFFLNINGLRAQETHLPNSTREYKRCGTIEWLATMERTYPGFILKYNNSEKKLGDAVTKFIEQQKADPDRVNAPMVIPIVFHVVLSNQSQVPDAMIMSQFNELNLCFSGLNPDSTNINYAPQFAIRGHSEIQFVLAQRTPDNLPLATPGIERRTSSTLSTGTDFATDQIKSTAAGGLDAWDPARFFNVWVCDFTDATLLGYSSFPIGSPENPVGPANQQGVTIESGSLPGGASSPFNLGRTLVHETGHFLWLRHIWGDATCGDDFPSTPSLDDTPAQSGSTSGCPSGEVASGCPAAPTPPGRMYQNFMDYTNDACYSLFTKGQVVRTYQAVNTFMPSLLSSNGGIPPVLVPNNAGIAAVVTPSANFITCDPTLPLTITLRNYGSNPLTSVTISVTVNGTLVQSFIWTGNLASIATANVPLNPVSLALGTNSIVVCTVNPNTSPDPDPENDCRTINGIRGTGGTLPLIEGFENTTFPPAGWSINNPDGDVTWQRTITGVAHNGIAKATMNHFSYSSNVNATDDLRTPPFAIGTADSLWVSFWAAYRGYPGVAPDQFQVMVSTDCGQTFQVVYNARNDTAFVAPEGVMPTYSSVAYFPSNANEWKKKSIDLSSFIPAGNVLIQFRTVNKFANNMHIDDINIDKKTFANNDAGVIAINKPDTRNCINSLAPVVIIKNFGKINLTSVKINYQIDGTGAITTFNWTGNLARNQTTTVTLANVNLGVVGDHLINIYTTLPNNVADEDPSNDGLTKTYNVSQISVLPTSVTEEFTSTTFPPSNWYIYNPDGDIPWQRSGFAGNKNTGSAFFYDFINTSVDHFDDLGMPNYSYSGIDSIFLTFNVAHATKNITTGIRKDTLTVLVSKDCGNTFTTVYQKWGEELQTTTTAVTQSFVPAANEWRRDSVNLGTLLGAAEPLFQVAFRFSGNMENNLYMDDVNIRTQVLPAKLKSEGYLILPNPFRTAFGIWHYQVPTDLRYLNVYNSVGQLVYSRRFPGGGEKFFQVDLSNKAPGMYSVYLGYRDSKKDVTVQIVKY